LRILIFTISGLGNKDELRAGEDEEGVLVGSPAGAFNARFSLTMRLYFSSFDISCVSEWQKRSASSAASVRNSSPIWSMSRHAHTSKRVRTSNRFKLG
jgi:hypothetical protein